MDISRVAYDDSGGHYQGQSRPAQSTSSSGRDYKRDEGGQFSTVDKRGAAKPRPAAKPGAKPAPKRIVPVRPRAKGPMKRGGGDNDPEQVRQLQALLGVLGLGKPPTSGDFDATTEAAVKAAQERLGLKPTGRASSALLNRLIDAHALSPCVQRSADVDEYELLRAAVAAGDFDEDETQGRPAVADEILRYERSWPLEGIEIRRSGSGRQVEAYAAIWDTPAEVNDQHGHYMERISRTAFDKTIRERGDRIPVFYNHGMNVAGSPSDRWSVPIGRSLEVRAEARGLWTLSQYNEGPDTDQVLEAIRNGAITSQSFRGRVYKSDPMKVPRLARGADLPMVTRTELGLTEYGPTPTAVYDGAAILALRSQLGPLATLLGSGYDLDQLVELARTSTTPEEEPETDSATSTEEAGAEEPLVEALRSAAMSMDDIRRKGEVFQILERMPRK